MGLGTKCLHACVNSIAGAPTFSVTLAALSWSFRALPGSLVGRWEQLKMSLPRGVLGP